MRDNFERLGLPGYEERISRRHGGTEFVFDPCPLGEHGEGNNTGLITVAPSGKLGWHCFHSSHAMPWREARKQIEAAVGQTFVFPALPLGSERGLSDDEDRQHFDCAASRPGMISSQELA
jgi:hypothetical protein